MNVIRSIDETTSFTLTVSSPMETYELRSGYGTFSNVGVQNRPGSSCQNTSTAEFSVKLHRLPVIRELATSSCYSSIVPGVCSYTLTDAPRSFDSIDFDNGERPRGLWYEFLQTFDPLEFQSDDSGAQNPTNTISVVEKSPEFTFNDANKETVTDSSEFAFSRVIALPTESLEFPPRFKIKPHNQNSIERNTSLTECTQHVCETRTSSTVESSDQSLCSSNHVQIFRPVDPEESGRQFQVRSFSSSDHPSGQDGHFYLMDYTNDYERSPLNWHPSMGRRHAGRSKDRRIRSSALEFTFPSTTTPKVTEIASEGDLLAFMELSFTERVLPVVSELHQMTQLRSETSMLDDDSAKASMQSFKGFEFVTGSDLTYSEVTEPDSAFSFETRIAEARRDAELEQNANSKRYGSVRKVAGASDRKRVPRTNSKDRGTESSTTTLKKPSRFLQSLLCSSSFN